MNWKRSIEKIVGRGDVFGQLPTGYGNSLTLQLLPGVLSCLKALGYEFPSQSIGCRYFTTDVNCWGPFRFGAIARTRKGACTVISRSFPRSVDVVAWPVQRRFAYRAIFRRYSAPMLRLAISSALLTIFFLKLSTTIFPLCGPSN